MPKIAYIKKNFSSSSREVIDQASEIIAEYRAQGFILTLRQLFYQEVARGHLPNTQQSYRRLGSIISDARRAGLIDWDSIEDRTRFARAKSHWEHPREVLESAAYSFRLDMWTDQPCRPSVWIEKDALTGVIDPVCTELDIPYYSCRGYPSDSMVWRAAQQIIEYWELGQQTRILHLGDHDPSGWDMTLDIRKRLLLFTRTPEAFDVNRLALNMDQIEEFQPPPNPLKLSSSKSGFADPRATWYIENYGLDSWELDALSPTVLSNLVREEVWENLRDAGMWESRRQDEEDYRDQLATLADEWED